MPSAEMPADFVWLVAAFAQSAWNTTLGAAGLPVTLAVPEIVPSAARLGMKVFARLAGRLVILTSISSASPALPVTLIDPLPVWMVSPERVTMPLAIVAFVGAPSFTGIAIGVAAKLSRLTTVWPLPVTTFPDAVTGLSS